MRLSLAKRALLRIVRTRREVYPAWALRIWQASGPFLPVLERLAVANRCAMNLPACGNRLELHCVGVGLEV